MDIGDLLEDAALEFISSNDDADIDQLFLAAFVEDPTLSLPNPALPPDTSPVRSPTALQLLPSSCNNAPRNTSATTLELPSSAAPVLQSQRFAKPTSEEEIIEMRKKAIPEKTVKDTKYCVSIWEEWCKHREQTTSCTIPSLCSITLSDLQFWLVRFILEVRKKNGSEYPPDTLHHLCSGIVRFLRTSGTHPSLDIFRDPIFAPFRSSLDAEMKRLQSNGLGSKHNKAEPITDQEEDLLWEKGQLGDNNCPRVLLQTIFYMVGVFFALRSGQEHRALRFSPSQIEIIQRDNMTPYLLYTEDLSKNRPGGLKGRRVERKVVKHFANLDNPQRCFVRLLQKYKSLCPDSPKNNAFYLQPLKTPSEKVWFSREPIGKNKLATIVKDMCAVAGITGYRTNHSLRATTATRLYSAGTDEQLIMERTGHRSVDGVRSYKRTADHLTEDVSNILNHCKKPRQSMQLSTTSAATPSTASLSPSSTSPSS